MTDPVILVGGGQAAGKAVTRLRESGYDGDVILFTDEPHHPYERPPLSKEFLQGSAPAEKAQVHPRAWYADNDVDVRLGTRVTEVDPAAHTVSTDSERLGYSSLLLATGARPRRLPLVDDAGVPATYLRTVDDSAALRERLGPGRRLGIIGGGWIGLEVAASARQLGTDVVVLEAQEQPLVRVLGTELGATFAALHRQHGVDLRTGVSVEEVTRQGDLTRIRLGDGSVLEVDHLVVGVGVLPNDELARAAGIATDNGILVDAQLHTSAPDVYAAGDVANVAHPTLGRLRVEHWDTATRHGQVAADNILGGSVVADALPYFFTDQYDLGMEYVGHADARSRVVVRGALDGPLSFTAFWVRDGQLLAAMHANTWDAMESLHGMVGRCTDAETLSRTDQSLAQIALTMGDEPCH